MKYLKNIWKSWVITHSFEITVAGKYKAICLLSPQGGSSQFDSVKDDYDIKVVINKQKNNELFNVSLYKESDDILPDFNCGEYVKSIDPLGGGHRSASGMKITLDKFIDILKNKTL